jgi:LAO/AO transport system kinase
VLTCSAQLGTGLDEVWQQVLGHRAALAAAGVLDAKRRRQLIGWTWAMVRDGLLAQLRENEVVRDLAPGLERQVLAGTLTPALAAEQILSVLSARPE